MSLYEHYSEGTWIPEGVHLVRVTNVKTFVYTGKGSPGLEVHVSDSQGRTIKVSFVLVPTALWNLANFAAACGLSEKEMRAYNEQSIASHRVLVGRRLQVQVRKEQEGKDGKLYCKVVGFCKVDEPPEPAATAPAAVPVADGGPPDDKFATDNIPF